MQETRDGQHDFDFFIGTWKGYNRRLRERLKGCTDWDEFEGHSEVRKVLGGVGNFDEVTFYRDGGEMQGVTLRLYDPNTHEWSIYWASSVGSNNLFPPMIGKFDENGRGLFYAYEPFEGCHVYSRFIWTHEGDTARWEQAFSIDGGQTWETNWTADFVRES